MNIFIPKWLLWLVGVILAAAATIYGLGWWLAWQLIR
jgi:hypothetical protein